MTHKLQIYKGKKGGWYIRIVARNGWRICARFNGAYTLLGVWFYFNF